MCVSLFYAQVIGAFLFFMSLAMLISQTRYKKFSHDVVANATTSIIMGMIGLLLGLIIVMSHNIWVTDWPVLITIIGWFLVLINLFRLFFPEPHAQMVRDSTAKNGYTFLSWIWMLVALYLLWAGFAG